MTVQSFPNPVFLLGDGVNTIFPFPWFLLDVVHLTVNTISEGGVVFVPQLGIDYTVAGVGSEGGTVTFLPQSIPAVNATVVLARILPAEQPTDLSTASLLDLPTIERMVDRQAMIIDTVLEALSRRPALRLSTLNALRNLEEPQPIPLHLLGWNATGTERALFPSALQPVLSAVDGPVVLNKATQAVSAVSGENQIFTSGLVPPGSRLTDLMAYVRIEASDENGLVSWSLGTMSAYQRFARGKLLTVGTQTNAGETVNYVQEPSPSGLEARLTAAGGPWGVEGEIIVTAQYIVFAVPTVVP